MDQRRHWRASSRSPRDLRAGWYQKAISIYPSTGDSEAKTRRRMVSPEIGRRRHQPFPPRAFLRSGLDRLPDLQFLFLPIAMNYDGSQQVNHHGTQAHVGPMKPLSRGQYRSTRAIHSRRPRFNSTISVPKDWAVCATEFGWLRRY
ncbi:MAG: hypothetical protein CM15mP3_05020 [Candidatus Poseidoniales archaeon]|nr:MAG: hypothetical protein CM15mP3_05020 [Candidatus Poseidoniales archaeon]